jgi:hypothetical protein
LDDPPTAPDANTHSLPSRAADGVVISPQTIAKPPLGSFIITAAFIDRN